MNILLISYNYSPELTGIGKYNAEFSEYLVIQGHSVEVITGFPNYPHWELFKGYSNSFYSVENLNGVEVTRCPLFIPTNPSGSKRMIMDFSFYLTSLFVLIKKVVLFSRYDLVFVPSPSFLMGIHILFLRFFWRKTIFVYHIQDLQIDAALELGIIKYPWIKRILLKIENLIFEKSTVVSTISVGMRKKILAKSEFLKDVLIMPNWVDDQVIYTTEIKQEVISNLGIPLNKKIFLYSGAIGEKQGLDSLLIVAKKLKIQCPDLLFVISGTGPFKKKLEQIASDDRVDNIKFIDLQPNEGFNQLLNYASCHLIIQKKQGSESFLPSKLGAILAVGGLSIVTAEKETSLYDIVQNNNLGIVIEPENEDALYESIVMVYDQILNPEESAQIHNLKNNAKYFAVQYLQKESIIDSFMIRIKEIRQLICHNVNF